MMYDLDTVIAALKNRVGFRSTPEIPLDADLSQSDTGLYFNDVHVQLTPNIFKATTPSAINNDPDEEVRRNKYLTEIRNGQIANVINQFLTTKIIRGTTTGTEMSRPLFNSGSSSKNLSPKIDSIVGWRFSIGSDSNMRTKIKRVSFQGTASGLITLNLYNSGLGIVDSIILDYDTPGKVKWFETAFDFKNYDPASNYSSSDWFLGYDCNAYSGQAIKAGQTWGSNCFGWCSVSYRIMKGNGIWLMPASFQNSQGYDIANLSYNCDDNHGLNLDIWSGCDYTQFIADNAANGIFDNAIYINVGVKLLSLIVNNPSTNIFRETSNVESKLNFLRMELVGNKDAGVNGLYQDAKDSIEAIHANTEGLSSRCFKKDDRGKISVSYR